MKPAEATGAKGLAMGVLKPASRREAGFGLSHYRRDA